MHPYLSIRCSLTAGLLGMALLVAPLTFAKDVKKVEITEIEKKAEKEAAKKAKEQEKEAAKKEKVAAKTPTKDKAIKDKPSTGTPPSTPTVVPELDGGEWVSAAALLAGAFLLLSARRKHAAVQG